MNVKGQDIMSIAQVFRLKELMSEELLKDLTERFDFLSKIDSIVVEFSSGTNLESFSIKGIEENFELDYELNYFIFDAKLSKDGEETPFVIYDDYPEFNDVLTVFEENKDGNIDLSYTSLINKRQFLRKGYDFKEEKYSVIEVIYNKVD